MHHSQCPENNKNYHKHEVKGNCTHSRVKELFMETCSKTTQMLKNWQTRTLNNYDKCVLKNTHFVNFTNHNLTHPQHSSELELPTIFNQSGIWNGLYLKA